AYHRLALTVGARVRTHSLPGSDLPGIFYMRTIGDVHAIHQYTGKGKRAVIVGGGYIGLETAAMLRQTGMQVTVLEMAERILGRVTAPEVAGFFSRIHREEGVEIITGAQVTGFSGKGRVMAVACGDQQNLEADLVIIGIGIIPNVELAQQAGLKVDDGILVNEHCQTSASDIVAAGDCTRHFNSLFQRSLRLESVQNAVEQARVAAATVCGKTKEYNALPWFWSDQYDMKLQIAGLSMDYDELVIRGDVGKGRSFAAFYLKNNVLIAVDAVNRPQEFLLGKQLITAQVEPDKVKLGDTDIPMKEIVSGSLK
ncbi:MAG: FAD/NAD(P)-binding oxidoreductase, partial [Pseudohongiellaceae bacterium]